MRKIGAVQIQALAELIAHNVYHTEHATTAFDSAKQAIRAHEDTVSECAEDSFGRRLTEGEWRRVAKLAEPLVSFVMYRLRGSYGLVDAAEHIRALENQV